MRTAFLQVGLIAASVGCAFAARADTLEDALVSAYQTNPQIEARRAQGRATDEGVSQALSGWRPTVSFTTYAGRGDYQANNSYNYLSNVKDWTLTVNQSLYSGGRTVAATKKAEEGVKAERAQLRAVEQGVLRDAAAAYVGVCAIRPC